MINAWDLPCRSQPLSCSMSVLCYSSGQVAELLRPFNDSLLRFILLDSGLKLQLVRWSSRHCRALQPRCEDIRDQGGPTTSIGIFYLPQISQNSFSLPSDDWLFDLDLPNCRSQKPQALQHSWNTTHPLASALELIIHGSDLRCCCRKDLGSSSG